MQFGVFLTIPSPDGDQTAQALYARAFAIAEEAEALGFSKLWLAEHHFTNYATSARPLQLLSHLAARTQQIRLGPAIIPIPLHHPLVVAEELATLDVLSGGRLEVGLGKGYAQYQYDRLGIDRARDQGRFLEALVVRGTNSAAPYDLLEDFGVHSAVAWPFGEPAPLQPQIARGYGLAMQAIAAMEPTAGAAAAGQTLLQWLSALTAEGAAIELICTGQSLGGGLAPTVALWLQNVQGTAWDPKKQATVGAISFAGPTAGDADFAAWSEACLGERLIRVVNSLDVAPRTWNAAQMTTIPDLYGTIAGDKVAALLVAAQLRLSAGVSYTQPFADLPPLEGTLDANQTFWFTQAAWQHVYGYLQILGLQRELPLVAWIFGPGATAEPAAAA
jgi:hypothetical protein